MLGIDTSVLIQYLTQADPAQSAIATQLFESLTEENQGFVSTTVLVELSEVLENVYSVSQPGLAATLGNLVRTRELKIQDREVVLRALRRYITATCTFADCLIVEQAREYGCGTISTLDPIAASAGMTLEK